MHEKLQAILDRHGAALGEELRALYGEDAGFVITAGLTDRDKGSVTFQTSGNLTNSVACKFFQHCIDVNELNNAPKEARQDKGKLH